MVESIVAGRVFREQLLALGLSIFASLHHPPHSAVGGDPSCLPRHQGAGTVGRETFQEIIPALEWLAIRQSYMEVTKIMKIYLQNSNSACFQISFPLVAFQYSPSHMTPSSWRGSVSKVQWGREAMTSCCYSNLLFKPMEAKPCEHVSCVNKGYKYPSLQIILFPRSHQQPVGQRWMQGGCYMLNRFPPNVEALTLSTSG